MSNMDRISKEEKMEKMKALWKKAYKLRSVVLGLPVAAVAIVLAVYNLISLPAQVGFNLQSSGEYSLMVAKGLAVLGPVAITAICLLMMFCSKRVVYPWLISIFSLVLPWLIYITNVFPA